MRGYVYERGDEERGKGMRRKNHGKKGIVKKYGRGKTGVVGKVRERKR
jgi:hypothetical protein